jgi:uncharacterized protein
MLEASNLEANNDIRPLAEYDFGVPLYASRWTFRQETGPHTLLYTPDRPGMPILVSDEIAAVYDAFAGGATAGAIIARFSSERGRSFTYWLKIIEQLMERGFLREAPDADFFTPERHTSPKTTMNIWLHVNNNCNLACSYCFVEHTKMALNPEVIKETTAAIVKTVDKHGVNDILVKFAGGEATLSLPQMEYFHDALTEALRGRGVHLHWAVLTNGTNVTDRFLRFIDRANVSVSISIDGYGAYHDLYRVYKQNEADQRKQPPRGSWDEIIANIGILRARGVTPYINAMVGPKTSKGLPELAKWIYGNGMSSAIHVVRNVGDSWARGDRAAEYGAYCDQLAEDFEAMFCELEDSKYVIGLPNSMEIAELSFDQPAPDICCGIGSDHIVIKYDGSLASCPMTVHERTVKPVDDLFEAAAQTFTVSPADRSGSPCLSCQWFKVCAGACPVANERIQGHAFAVSPLCKFWKYVIPRYLAFYGRKLLQAERARKTPDQLRVA